MQRILTILCALIPFVVTFEVSQVVNEVSPANRTIYLNCTLPLDGNITWFYNDEKVDLSNDNYKVEHASVIVNVGHETSGRYRCVSRNSSQHFTLYASPNVKQYEKVKNVIEDDPFQVECIAWGTLPLTVTWTYNGAPVTADERVTYKNNTGSGRMLANSTLRIQSMKYEDQGDYVCVVENEHGNGTATITVHVKDKLAALWPFLGICAEVAILCTIIFIYEKRRNKRLEEEAMRDEADQLNAMDTKPNSDVRQRK